jgi:hypothetical protein
MLKTAEIRWFHRDAPPEETRRYVEGENTRELKRTDLYLAGTETPHLGVKLREGRIELKQLTNREPGSGRLPWLQGWIEHHCKWSFPLADAGAAADLTGTQDTRPSWIAVEKSRLLRIYEVLEDGEVVQVTERVDFPTFNGCSLELVALTVGGVGWWSLGLEAVGPEERRVENLLVLLRRMRPVLTYPLYSLDRSCGYAPWLTSHCASRHGR